MPPPRTKGPVKKFADSRKKFAANKGLANLVKNKSDLVNAPVSQQDILNTVSNAPQKFGKDNESRRAFIERNTKNGEMNEAAKAMFNFYNDGRNKYQLDMNEFRNASPENKQAYAKRFPVENFAMEGLPNLIPGVSQIKKLQYFLNKQGKKVGENLVNKAKNVLQQNKGRLPVEKGRPYSNSNYINKGYRDRIMDMVPEEVYHWDPYLDNANITPDDVKNLVPNKYAENYGLGKINKDVFDPLDPNNLAGYYPTNVASAGPYNSGFPINPDYVNKKEGSGENTFTVNNTDMSVLDPLFDADESQPGMGVDAGRISLNQNTEGSNLVEGSNPVGEVSSRRIAGQDPNVNYGDEYNSLDVQAELNNRANNILNQKLYDNQLNENINNQLNENIFDDTAENYEQEFLDTYGTPMIGNIEQRNLSNSPLASYGYGDRDTKSRLRTQNKLNNLTEFPRFLNMGYTPMKKNPDTGYPYGAEEGYELPSDPTFGGGPFDDNTFDIAELNDDQIRAIQFFSPADYRRNQGLVDYTEDEVFQHFIDNQLKPKTKKGFLGIGRDEDPTVAEVKEVMVAADGGYAGKNNDNSLKQLASFNTTYES